MNLSPEQMQYLADKGLSLAEVIEFASMAASKSSGAERQARYRARKKAEAEGCDVTSDVTRDAVTDDEAPLSRPLSPQTPQTPTHTPVKQTPARKGHRMPDDWQPKPLPATITDFVRTWPPGALERELARFRDWAASANGPNALKKDWDAAWRNWLRKADDENRYGKPANDYRNSKPTGTANAAQRAIASLGG